MFLICRGHWVRGIWMEQLLAAFVEWMSSRICGSTLLPPTAEYVELREVLSRLLFLSVLIVNQHHTPYIM